jgi:hypothetical protein
MLIFPHQSGGDDEKQGPAHKHFLTARMAMREH